jgi:riboflavin kinase/FMN adenylyltransferase
MSPLARAARIVTLDELPAAWRGGVVAIGNFDGVHRGHRAVLDAARAEAKQRGVAAIVLTLEPHPRAFFSGRPIFRLTPAPLKAALAAALGLDGTLILPFDRVLAERSAEDFVREMLVERLGIAAAVTGYDFQFGKARRGTPEFLREEGSRHGFAVTIVGALEADGEAVSSTRIRAALAAGDVGTANRLLGWHFAVTGTVIRGDGRGRELGYPTANMRLDPATELAHGIYAVRYLRPDGSSYDGVASFGRRPTFGGGDALFETFLFDFSGDLYGETALVSLYGFVRPEKRFDGVPALVAQMEQDSIDARAILARSPPLDIDTKLRPAWAGADRHSS